MIIWDEHEYLPIISYQIVHSVHTKRLKYTWVGCGDNLQNKETTYSN